MRYYSQAKAKKRSRFGPSMISINSPISTRFDRLGRAPMARVNDERCVVPEPSTAAGARSTGELKPHTGRSSRVIAVDVDSALFGLLEEWLAAAGYGVTLEQSGDEAVTGQPDVLLVDIPFPRQGGMDSLRRVASRYPATPILVLSSTFFAGIDGNGAVGRKLGVAWVA